MHFPILSLSDRGQITIPQKIRKSVSVKHFVCRMKDGNIILEPLQTREEFLQELDEAEKDWEKNGGKTLNQMRKKY